MAAVGTGAVSRGLALAHLRPTSQEPVELHLLPDKGVFGRQQRHRESEVLERQMQPEEQVVSWVPTPSLLPYPGHVRIPAGRG